MDNGIRKILERPFPAEAIKQRQGPNGMQLSYVEVQAYIDRLNEAFHGEWSWEVTHREQLGDQLVIEGRLTAGSVVKTGLGGTTVTRRRNDDGPLSLADDYKKAEADGLKRACRLLGIGGHLYSSDTEEDWGDQRPSPPPSRPRTEPAPRAQPATNGTSSSMPRPMAERNHITQKQLGALLAICRSRGWEDGAFRQRVRDRFGVTIDYLTRQQASDLIGSLSGNGEARQPGQEG